MDRLNLDEVAEIARLAARQSTRSRGLGPTSHEVGAALGMPASDVERMLSDLRLRNGGAPYASPASERRTILLAVGSVVGFALVAGIAILISGRAKDAGPSPAAGAPPTVDRPAAVSGGAAYAPAAQAPLGVARGGTEAGPDGLAPQTQGAPSVQALTAQSELDRARTNARARETNATVEASR